ELWPVTGGPMYNTRFDEVLTELGLESEMTHPDKIHTLYYPDATGKYQPQVLPHSEPGSEQGMDPEYFMKLVNWLGMPMDKLDGLVRYTTDMAAITPEQIDALDDVTYHDFIAQYDFPQPFYSMLAAQFNVVFVQTIDQIAASEVIKTMQDMSKNGAGYYSKGGYGRIFERCAEWLASNGGEVRLQTRVNGIVVENGRIKGVATDKGEFRAPIVVSNAGIQPTTLKLVGEEHFDKGYLNYVRELVPSHGLMGIRYFLDAPVMDGCSHIAFSDDSYWSAERASKAKTDGVPDELLIFATVPSNFDPDLAPPGKQCVLASTLAPADPDMPNTQAWWDKIDEMMEKIWPGFQQHVETKETYGSHHVSALTRDQVLPGIGGECIGLGQVAGQCGKSKPSPKAPIQGLFYVGCDAGGYGCGTHQAVDSALNVSGMVHRYHQNHYPFP
ncbi:MAG: NAD(P)/FAD-dependent oxidoreductase, partial [Proteobacteria bacterium]|nr:NAD(P)/FAD-dependent oxidoreductase [Pseudomonadota bacterium]